MKDGFSFALLPRRRLSPTKLDGALKGCACWPACRALLDGPDPRIFACAAAGDVAGLRQLFAEVRLQAAWGGWAGAAAGALGSVLRRVARSRCLNRQPFVVRAPAPDQRHSRRR